MLHPGWLNTDFYRDFGYNLVYPQLYPITAAANEGKEFTRLC